MLERGCKIQKSSFRGTSQVSTPSCLVRGSVLNVSITLEESPRLPAFNAEAMAQLEGMGFPTVRCQKALLATGNADPTAAMEWLFEHMEDPGMNLPETHDIRKSLTNAQALMIRFLLAAAAGPRVQSHL